MADHEAQFYADSKAFVDETLEFWPTAATQMGDHRYDDRLADITQSSLQRRRSSLGTWLKSFEKHETASWSLDAQIDHIIMVQMIRGGIRDFDRLRNMQRSPRFPLNHCFEGINSLILNDFAPLPERMKGILGRLREIPRVLAEGRELLEPADVPKIWADIARESTFRSLELFTTVVPNLANSCPDVKMDVMEAAETAVDALKLYAAWLESSVLPAAAGDFAIGRELFDEILREEDMVDYDAEDLINTGWRLLEETKRQVAELARTIDPNKTAKELLEKSKRDHPTAEGLLDAYRQKMNEARQFVVDHDIATIPQGESIHVEPTPPYIRALLPYAAYMPSGPLEKEQKGIFFVTPVEENADDDGIERKLRSHPWANIPVTALHEAYPGHHLQISVANTLDSLPRKLATSLSSLFPEGWAFYCEELMDRLGFISLPIQRLARLQEQLWRACRIILDVSLHTRRMTMGEAADFLAQHAELEPDDAMAEAQRYTMNPTQPQTYLMGKLLIADIVSEYKRRHPDETMRQMHDAILRCGSLPPKLMRLRLFGQESL